MRCTYTLSFSFCARNTFCTHSPARARASAPAADIRAYIGISSYREPFYLMYDPANVIDKTAHLSLTLYGDRLSLLRLLPSFVVTGEARSLPALRACPNATLSTRNSRRYVFFSSPLALLLSLCLYVFVCLVSPTATFSASTEDRSGGINDSVRRRSQFVFR